MLLSPPSELKCFSLSGTTRKRSRIYGAVRRLIAKYSIDAVAILRFDLPKPYKASGCLPFAIFYSNGITAAPEGGTRSLLSMSAVALLRGESYLANPLSNPQIVIKAATKNLSMSFSSRSTEIPKFGKSFT